MDDKYILEESFGYLTGHTYRAINRRLRSLFEQERHPITVEQFGVLVHLWEKDGRCQNEIAAILDKDKPGISRLLKHLEDKKLIDRISDEDDCRKKLITLTKAGKDLEIASKKLALQVYRECTEGLDQNSIKNAKSVLINIKQKFN